MTESLKLGSELASLVLEVLRGALANEEAARQCDLAPEAFAGLVEEFLQGGRQRVAKFSMPSAAAPLDAAAMEPENANSDADGGGFLESERHFRALIDAAPIGVYVGEGLPGFLTYANPRLLAMLGGTMEESYGYGWLELVHPDNRDVFTNTESPLRLGEVRGLEARLRTKTGVDWVRITLTMLPGTESPARRRIGVVEDITDRKRAEERLLELRDKLDGVTRMSTVGEMASGMAHELNQPLGAMSAYIERCLARLESSTEADADLRYAIQQIARLMDRCAGIIKGLRKLVKRAQPHSSTVDLRTIIEDVLTIVRYEASIADVQLAVDVEPRELITLADPIQIQQVLLNLVGNAIRAMSEVELERRRLTIRAVRTGDGFIETSIRDNGPGVSPELGQHVFDAFVTTREDGLGMGLAMTRSIIEAHGGTLTFENETSGGATFRFRLPEISAR
jgi:two-component system, LuxR family, sensor kinase FixL